MANPYNPWPPHLEKNVKEIIRLVEVNRIASEYLITQAQIQNYNTCGKVIGDIVNDLGAIFKENAPIASTEKIGRGAYPKWLTNSRKIEIELANADKHADVIKGNIRLQNQQMVIAASEELLATIKRIKTLIDEIKFSPTSGSGSNRGGSGSQGYLVQGWPVSVGKRTM